MIKQTMTDEMKRAFQLIAFFGLISLFGDIVYEGARSVNGQYLNALAANAAMVGLITGLGEFAGYALRLITGYFADRTKAYWVFTFIGYGLIVAVPLLSLTGIWQVAAVLMVLERVGKGIRAPAKDAIVSGAAKRVGTGKGFAIQEVLDQIGALSGPLIFTAYFALTGGGSKSVADYRAAYGLFWIPFLLVMVFAVIAYMKVPDPSKLEPPKKPQEPDTITGTFWVYNAFSFVTALGLVSFALMGYHFKDKGIVPDALIPIMYAIAMSVDGAAAFVMGNLYDKLKERSGHHAAGLATLVILPVLSAAIPFLAFSGNVYAAFGAAVLLGVVMGAQETVMKAGIADITPIKKRGTGYGIFNFTFGLAMLAAGVLGGILYERSIPLFCWTVAGVQAAALVLFFVMKSYIRDKD